MWDLISNFVKAKTAELKVAVKTNAIALAALEESNDIVTERPGGIGWDVIGRLEKGLAEVDQKTVVAQARRFFRFDPNGRAAIMNALKYIMGRGVTITPKSDDPKVNHVWREFWTSPRNKMERRQFEIVTRALRDGNCLLQYFTQDETGSRTWKTTVRFRDPMLLQKPTIEFVGTTAQGSNGIVVDRDDIETPTQYWFKNQFDQNKYEMVEAAKIQHIKIGVDSDQKMGEPMIQAVMDLFTYYKQWLKARILLNKIRTAVALIKKVKGSSSDVSRISATLPSSSTTRVGETKTQQIRPMSVFVANEGVEYEMMSHNINATDAAEDGRTMITRMAGGTGQPEYAFGDASNANFASSLVSESPFVKEIQYWQQVFEFEFKEMFRRVIQAAVDAGVLSAPKESSPFDTPELVEQDQEPDENEKDEAPEPEEKESEAELFFGCDIQWPEIIHRDIKQNTDAVIAQRDAGLISDATASAALGYDYEEEVRKQRKIEEEAEDGSNPFKQPQQAAGVLDDEDAEGEMEIDKEARAVMATLSPEEKQKVMAMKPEEIAKYLSSKNGKSKQGVAQ